MENSTPTRKIAQLTWQDMVFGLAGSAGFVALLYVIV